MDEVTAAREPDTGSARAVSRGRTILWLSAEVPDRAGQGGQRRQFHQIRELTRLGHDVTVLSLVSDQNAETISRVARRVIRRRVAVRGVMIPGAVWRIRRFAAKRRWDAVVVSHHESAWMLPVEGATAPVLLDVHNVLSSWRLSLGAADVAADHAQEADALARASVVTVCSEVELSRLREMHPGFAAKAFAAPLGVDPEEWPSVAFTRVQPRVALFGSWGWEPNARGLEWFAHTVWPRVAARVPDARAEVAGSRPRDMSGWPASLHYVGRVPDIAPFAATAAVVAVPVLNGVGASVKFAESLATGAAVIATSDASSAFASTPCTVSDDADSWVDWIVEQLRIREHVPAPHPAREFALTQLTWAKAVEPIDTWLGSLPQSGANRRA